MNRLAIAIVACMFCCLTFRVSAQDATPKPPYERVLSEEQAKRAEELGKKIGELQEADDYKGANRAAEELLTLRTNAQGADHWETTSAKSWLGQVQKIAVLPPEQRASWWKARAGAVEAGKLHSQGKYAEALKLKEEWSRSCERVLGEKDTQTAGTYKGLAKTLAAMRKYAEAESVLRKALAIDRELVGDVHPYTAYSYELLADNLEDQRKNTEALTLFQKELEINRKLYGEKHSKTANSYNSIAINLENQAKYAEAQPYYQSFLELYRELNGETNPSTATAYLNLGLNLDQQAKYGEAQPLLQKALDIQRKLHGEKHADTGEAYNSLALSITHQGKFAEAQPLFQMALDIRREVLGERNADTTESYNSLGINLKDQGRYADAQPLLQKALDLNLDLFGERHLATANSYNSLAMNLSDDGKHAEAQPFFEKALILNRDLFTDKHPRTANSYTNLGYCLFGQNKYTEARPMMEKALEIRREFLGERHRDTARSYGNLGTVLAEQKKYAEALPNHQKALDLHCELFGELHPDTSMGYVNLAGLQHRLKEYAQAKETLRRALLAYEANRLSGAKGLARASLRMPNPYPPLAMLQAASEPEEAWLNTELTLARGLLDQQALRKTRVLAPEEQADQEKWQQAIVALQKEIVSLLASSRGSEASSKRLDQLITERKELEQRLAVLAVRASQREIAPTEKIQAALPADAALVVWLDEGKVEEHWGCIVRNSGSPHWERLPGSGPDGQWTDTDIDLVTQLRGAIARNGSPGEIASLAERLHAQRIAPLRRHLAGVKSLYVVPVATMAKLPVEVLTNEYTVSYVPSGTFLARLKEQSLSSGTAMLALADPVFEPGEAETRSATSPPPSGLLITQVILGGLADQAKLKAGDLLLKYRDVELTTIEVLQKSVAEHASAKSNALTVWKAGADKPLVLDVAPGKLNVMLAERGGVWNELPGTRIEADRISKLFGERARVLTDTSASEQELESLRLAGELTKYRYLHFATHGEGNNVRAFDSTIILAQDNLPKDPMRQPGKPLINGQVSASEVLECWDLHAELVTLSACETATGREGGGDGQLGFAQAFLTAGSRAVCLSLWKVDDIATTLLMDRFYQNLLGKRPGLDKPMGKAAALAEAKNWLRNLFSDEALKLTADMTKGVVRGKGQKALPVAAVPKTDDPAAAKTFKPFDHPKYWAAFILIGDPN